MKVFSPGHVECMEANTPSTIMLPDMVQGLKTPTSVLLVICREGGRDTTTQGQGAEVETVKTYVHAKQGHRVQSRHFMLCEDATGGREMICAQIGGRSGAGQ
jgi:hypothetical protein